MIFLYRVIKNFERKFRITQLWKAKFEKKLSKCKKEIAKDLKKMQHVSYEKQVLKKSSDFEK